MKRRLIPLLVLPALAVGSGCTRSQIGIWSAWHNRDPQAAEDFANRPEIQEQLHRSDNNQDSGGSRRSSSTNFESGGTVWDRLADCESGGNWAISTGNGYSGGLQFLPSTWRAYGGSGSAHNASRSEQIRVAERIRADVGYRAWPACSARLGL